MSNRGRKFPPEPLTEAEALALLRACSRRSATGLRNAALLVLLWRTGLRLAEALALKPSDVDHAAGTVRVLHGKGDKARVVALGALALAVVARWADRRAALGLNGHAPLLCTLRGRALSQGYVRGLLPRLARRAGVAKRVHPHGLRHTFAAELRREGEDFVRIQRALGHAHLSTTARYVSHLEPTEVLDMLRARREPEGLGEAGTR